MGVFRGMSFPQLAEKAECSNMRWAEAMGNVSYAGKEQLKYWEGAVPTSINPFP